MKLVQVPRTADKPATGRRPNQQLSELTMPCTNHATANKSSDQLPPNCASDFGCLWESWSSAHALAVRLRGDIGQGGEFETLADYLFDDELVDIASMLLERRLRHLPRPGETIRIFQSMPVRPDAHEVIKPGAAVFTSAKHAQWFDDCEQDETWQLLETEVFPDELVTFGNPGHFIYVPRSVLMGYERHMRDTLRANRKACCEAKPGREVDVTRRRGHCGVGV